LERAKILGFPPTVVKALNDVSRTECALNKRQDAYARLLEAFQITGSLHDINLLLDILETSAEFLAAEGSQERSFQLVSFVLQHPQSSWKTLLQAKRLYRDMEAHFPRYVFQSSWERIEGLQLEGFVQAILAELAELLVNAAEIVPTSVEQPPLFLLTDREQEVLILVADGLSNAEIAEKLYIVPETVKSHVRNILSKLYVNNRTQAVAQARKLNLL
jgi:ATP/maltotriose-dependent transcriptional regulator MalT